MTLEQVKLLGIECKSLDYNPDKYEIEYDGSSYSDLESAIWGGIFGFCECGSPNSQLELIYECLKIIHIESKKGVNAWNLLNRDDNKYDIYLYLLDKHGFTEHCRMIYDSYLTERGKTLMYVLRYVLEHDIEDAEL